MMLKENEKKAAESVTAEPLPKDRNDPFVYFMNVIRGNIKIETYDLSSPANNEIVIKILDAAKHSAATGKTVIWKDFFNE